MTNIDKVVSENNGKTTLINEKILSA